MAQTLPTPAPQAWSLFRNRAQTAEAALAAVADHWRRFRAWRERRATIAELRALDDAILKDIGLHRSELNALLLGDGAYRRTAKRPPVHPYY